VFYVRESDLLARCARALATTGDRAAAAGRVLDAALPRGRAGVVHLYLESRCAQACEFCEQPVRRAQPAARLGEALLRARYAAQLDLVGAGFFRALLAAMSARTPPVRLVVTGDDWARDPHLDALLTDLATGPAVPVDFYGPSTRLADLALAQRLAALPALGAVTLTLQSPEPARHDAITGAPGSGAQALAAIANLRALGHTPRLNAVLTARGVDALPGLLRWLDDERLAVTLLGFIPDHGIVHGWDAAAVMAPMDAIRAALAADVARSARTVATLTELPRCAVPPMLHGRLGAPPVGLDREPARFPATCAGCADRPGCAGVSSSYERRFGGAGLVRREGAAPRS